MRKWLLGGLALLSIVVAAVFGLDLPGAGWISAPASVTVPARAEPFAASSPVRGTLVLTSYGGPRAASGEARSSPGSAPPGTGSGPVVHRTVFVPGPDYRGMEDNDLRGFLDGTFAYGWNQPGQIHVRLGRRDNHPRYGSFELYRNLHRWSDLRLPTPIRIHGVRLRLAVEASAADSVRLLLYAVKRDWRPGSGGVLENNVSPPATGEVWWRDRAYPDRPWGLPGAGYASETPEGDVDPSPLASAVVAPSDRGVTFSSGRLDRYAEDRIEAGKPLLFLVKLADYLEDSPGSRIALYTANHGDSRNTVDRPRLSVRWSSPSEVATYRVPVFLEHGRRRTVWRGPLRGRRLVATFIPDSGALEPTLRLTASGGEGRIRTFDRGGGSIVARIAPDLRGDSAHVVLLAAHDPVALGDPFRASLGNTWVRTGPPGGQRVPWIFVSPTGRVDTVLAAYEGGFRWSVRFEPDEIGRWRYVWSERFLEEPYVSPTGHFDVILEDEEDIAEALDSFEEKLESGVPRGDERWRVMAEFSRLQRAILLLQTPDSYRSPAGREIRSRFRRVREILSGDEVPDPVPLVPSTGPEWWERYWDSVATERGITFPRER